VDTDKIDYPAILQEALRGAVRQILAQVAEHGLPGEHFFYIEIRTDHPGVEVPRFLRDMYPEEMRIVLQNQFWDLAVDDEAFSVVLSFNATRHRLIVPFDALTAFVDPSVQFAVRFEPVGTPSAARAHPEPEALPPEKEEDEAPGRAAEVLRFDPSRRK
jgi:uncharacterized protein